MSAIEPRVDTDSAPFWDAYREGALLAQQCGSCGALRHPPGPICQRCGGIEAEWIRLSGHGRILSWTVTHVAYHESYRDRLPYTVLVVELDEQEGLLMYGAADPSDPRPSFRAPVVAELRDEGASIPTLFWRFQDTLVEGPTT